MISDIYYRQEQAVAMALRLEKKYKRESLYDSTNSKNDIDLAEIDHSLGMKGLQKINQQYYSVKNLNKSQEKQVPKMNQVEMLFDNVKKTNQQNGFFYYKEIQKLQKIISSGQLPQSAGSSQKKIKSRQGSQNQLSRNNFSSNQIQQEELQQEDKGQTRFYVYLEKQLNKAASKFSESGEMTFAQLGGFLNHIQVLQHIKYDETSKLSNEEEIINSQQLDKSFSSEMKLHELFWEVLCYNQINETDYTQKINSELMFSVTHFLLNKEKQESSPLSLKDNILVLLQSFKPSVQEQGEDGKCQQFPESILNDFILSWERVVSPKRLDQIVKDLTKDTKVKRRKVSFSNSKGSNLVIAQGESQSINSGSNQNIIFNNNYNAADNSFSSSNRPRVRSQSSSNSSVFKNMKKKENPLDVEQDISNLINRIKRNSEQIGEKYANSNNNIINQTAMTVFQGRERRYTASNDQRDKLYQSDNFFGFQTVKFNCYDDAATIHSLPTYLSKNNNTQSYQNINNNSYNQKMGTNPNQGQKYPYNQQFELQGVVQGMHITEISKDQYEQIQSSNPDYQSVKEVTFGEHKLSSPHDILRRKTRQINSQMNNLATPKKKSNQKSQIYESEGRSSISPSKSKEEMRVINLMKSHEEWKQEIIKKWILDKEDKEFEKQKDECTFQPNLGSSKKFNDNILKSSKNNVDVVSRLYDYSTPKKREIIQYQSLIEKQCQEIGECTFKPQTNSKQKQYLHIQSKISHSPISESSSQPSANKNKYSSNQKNKDDVTSDKSKDENNLSVKGFDQAVKRMKQGFEKTQEAKAHREKIRTGTLYQSNKNKQFKPPSMLERQKPKNCPFYYATINLTNGKHGKISLSEDDDPIQVALNFSKAFQLNKDMTEKLKINLIEQYKNHMLKLVASQI